MPYLIYSTGVEKEAIELNPSCEVTIGRTNENHIQISDDTFVSRKHCLIKVDLSGHVATIQDLGSSNGTYVNDEKLANEPVKLQDGSQITIGKATFIYCTENPEKYVDHVLTPVSLSVNLYPEIPQVSDEVHQEQKQLASLNVFTETVKVENFNVAIDLKKEKLQLEKGTEIEGGYTIIREIAQGPYSKTFLAYQKSVDRTVILKLFQIKPDYNFSIAFESLRFTLSNVSNVTEPRIVHYFDCGIHSNYIYLSMPYISEGSISDLIRRKGKIPIEQAINIISTIIEILKNVHVETQLPYLSINPSNIMFNDSGNISLTDYGLKQWKILFCQKTDSPNLWTRYDSPELKNNQKTTFLSDIYSLGILFCEMLTGSMQLTDQFEPKNIISKLKTSSEVKNLIKVMTEYSPEKRIQSYDSLLKLLKQSQQKIKSSHEPKQLQLRSPTPQRKIIIKKS